MELDCTNHNRSVWLVKVPKTVSNLWNSSTDPDVGKLKIVRQPGKKADITFTVNDGVLSSGSAVKNYKLDIQSVASQTLLVYSQTPEQRLAIEGKVQQRAECRPITSDAEYFKLKKQSIVKACQPQRVVQQLDRAVNNYKPITNHKNNIAFEVLKKTEGKKMREDKDKVMDMLFAAFEKHQYYNIKDLVRLTHQPVNHLKEVLKEICVYNVKNPHKNLWELKPEYRHYKEEPAS